MKNDYFIANFPTSILMAYVLALWPMYISLWPYGTPGAGLLIWYAEVHPCKLAIGGAKAHPCKLCYGVLT